ncbi:MAG TPA: hypothetical protein VGG79_11245 [Roseiarcus sp.]|jgi:hypothetical protein
MFCIICAPSPARGPRKTLLAGFLALASLFALEPEVHAQQQDSILKQAAKIFGFATDVGPPADFVDKTKPSGDLDYIPVFQPPPEPKRPALKKDQLKAMKGDLDGIEKEHNTLRQAFPPAAKALADGGDGRTAPKKQGSGAVKP